MMINSLRKTIRIFAEPAALLIGVIFLGTCLLAGPSEAEKIQIIEKRGEHIPLDLVFAGENGDSLTLRQLLNKPTILTFVYFNCPGICTPLLKGVVDVLEHSTLNPGKDYQVLTVSFNPVETYDLADKKKKNYLKLFNKSFPDSGWRWLTGKASAIRQLTEAAGFRFIPSGDKDYLHPAAMIVLSEEGEIVRYLHGVLFYPFDLKMALGEAGNYPPWSLKALFWKVIVYYDAADDSYHLNLERIFGITGAFLIVLSIFFLWFLRKRKGNSKAVEKTS